ncbi:nucleoprotein TPR-like [Chrysoperla carnea]|uniref:nucleoprotein TPR-like n=1 Tax=Chrysoperla carnea TaxID=189513 RepID=UPI001D07A47C|nr:nucleoprotein TPR-like [Chrysoperla carnea]
MEQIIMNYENQIKSLQQLPLKLDQAQYTNLQQLTIDRSQCTSLQQIDESQCTADDNNEFENEITCMLLHDIEYKTVEIEHDEEELQQLRSQSMDSTFNSICEQINEIVIRCESEHNSVMHVDLNKQIIDLIKSIEYKRNEIEYIQHELNVLIINNEDNEQIECNINEIIRLHDIIEQDLHELNDLKIQRLPVHGGISSVSCIKGDKYILSIRTLQELIEQNQKYVNRIKDQKTQISQDQMQYRNRVYHLQEINEKLSTGSISTHLDLETTKIVNDICDLLTKVESAQRSLEHCAIHLSQLLHNYQTMKLDNAKEIEQMENEIKQFNHIIKILERCKEIEENDGNDVGKYLTEIEKLKQKVDELQKKLEQSGNMVVYMDAIKHLHSHISKLDQQNRERDRIELHQEMTMNYIQKLTHAVDKLHPSKKGESTSIAQQNIQIDIPKSVEYDRVEISSDIPIEVYNLRVDNEELKTTQEDLLTQMRSIEDENRQYREDIDALQLKYQTALQDNEALQLKYENAIQDLESCNANSNNITAQYEEKESEINKLKEQISHLRTQLDTIIEENIHLIKINQNGQSEQQNNYPQETLSTGYDAEESVKKILSNQTQHQNYIDELEKRIENYDFIIQTIGTDGHFTHLFLMIGESIRALEGKLRDLMRT